jgi:hypothetical protein
MSDAATDLRTGSPLAIWKFPLEVTDMQNVTMPMGSKLLTVQLQNGAPCLWALCDTTAPMRLRTVWIFGTGHPVPMHAGEYLGTFQLHSGTLVFHAFGGAS